MREYEVTLIANGQMNEGDCQKAIEKYEKIILGEDGEVLKKDVWGTRKLSYPIKKQFRGYYVNYDLVAQKENIAEAERLMRIDDQVLRYLSIRINDNCDVEKRKLELAKIAALKATQQQSADI